MQLSQLSTPTLLLSIAFAYCIYATSIAIYRLYLSPLAKFPGPKLAALTRWYEAYYDVIQDGQYTNKIGELHKKYGPIIRISPFELHVSDHTFYEKLYRQEGRWNKYPWSYDAFGVPYATICTANHELHRQRRAPLNQFFSKTSVLKRQELIRTRVEHLCQRIDQVVEQKAVFNLGTAFCAMTIDIATDYVLGKSYDSLSREDYNQSMANMLQGSGAIWRTTKHLPFLDALVKSLPLSWVEKMGNADMKEFMAYLRTTKAQTADLMRAIQSGPKEEEDFTMVHTIVQSPTLPPSEKLAERINDDVDTVVGAGLETTAAVLRLIVFYLYSSPDQLNKLREGLQGLSLDNMTVPQLEQLPYLASVLHEGLRLSPSVGTRLARIAPDRDLVYNDQWVIPAGTPVGMSQVLMSFDDTLYPDARSFKPERWMDMDYRRKAEKTFAPFSRGTRNCLGMHLAWAELYIALPKIVMRYDFDLQGVTSEDVDAYSDQFIIGTKRKNCFKVMQSYRKV